MAPAGLAGALSLDRSQITLNWSCVSGNLDGSSFPAPSAPMAVELSHYAVHRATSLIHSTWVRLTTVPITTHAYTDNVPDPNGFFIYRIDAVDSLGTADTAMLIDIDRSLYIFAKDKVTRLKIPFEMISELRGNSNKYGSDLLVRAVDKPGRRGAEDSQVHHLQRR